jgi:hypothetical protein
VKQHSLINCAKDFNLILAEASKDIRVDVRKDHLHYGNFAE